MIEKNVKTDFSAKISEPGYWSGHIRASAGGGYRQCNLG